MIKFSTEDKKQLTSLAADNSIYIEGPVLKMIDAGKDLEFKSYLANAIKSDQSNRRKRLEITKQIQSQNNELQKAASDNHSLMEELKEAVQNAEDAKVAAVNDLDLIQKKTQFELIGNIVNIALFVIVGVGLITTLLYVLAIFAGSAETTLIGSTWSNLFGILLTNSFSIIGTIMGVKYASEKSEGK
jgi:hypothetical protein